MSISLVVVRLEIADDSPRPVTLDYTAPHCSVPRSTYAKIAGSSKGQKVTKSEISTIKGRREYQSITIETHHNLFSGEDFEDWMMEPYKSSSVDGQNVPRECLFESEDLDKSSVKSSETTMNMSKNVSQSTTDNLNSGACGDDSQLNHGSLASKSKSPSPPTLLGEGHLPPRKFQKRDQTSISFFSGNPSVETTEGIIHLYKNSTVTSLSDDVARSEMICILSVPASTVMQELLKFLASVLPYVEIMKVIRDASPNQYMVLLKFRSQKYADECFENFNNQPFNSFEPEICHLVYVAKLEALSSSEGAGLAIPSLTELPSCPVCLERMDESVDGILTILCNHSFHSQCLAQWSDTSCPVCRYIQTPEYSANNRCFRCNSQESLWICLICGHVGCGRYAGGHAFSHFKETNHTYSMQVGSNHVWDYAGDNYVHRLVANKGDGKLVQVDEGGNLVQEEKLDSITLEYTYLLTSQLESQRLFFEERIEQIEKEALQQAQEMELKSKKALEECNLLDRKLTVTTKERHITEKKLGQLHDRMGRVLRELSDEREMNKCLRQNQSQWQDRVKQMEVSIRVKDKEMSELQEQLRDVMFYLEAQQKLTSSSDVTKEELEEGQIVVGASGGSAKKGHRKKGK